MKFRLLAVVFAMAVGLATQAHASTEYYLVGLRHVYMFDVWPDPYQLDRQAIEEDYSGALSAAQQQYDTDMASIRTEESQDNGSIHQLDRDAVQQNLEQDIADAADTRDASLSQLYVECDYVRDAHPELAVDQDGPYQVMELEVDPDGEFSQVVFHRPYHLYLGPCPFGWTYGHGFPFFSLGMQVRMAHSRWKANGSPVFSTIYHGGVAITFLAPVRLDVITSRKAWAGGRPPAITDNDRKVMSQMRNLQRQAGIRPPSTRPATARPRTVSVSGSPTSRYAKKPSASRPQPTTASRYSQVPSRPLAGRGGQPVEPVRSRGNSGGSQGNPSKGNSGGSNSGSGPNNDENQKKKGG